MKELPQDIFTFIELGIWGICLALLFLGMRELPKRTENNTLKAIIIIAGIGIFIFLCVILFKGYEERKEAQKHPKKPKENTEPARIDTATIDTAFKSNTETVPYNPPPDTNVLSSRFVAGNWHAESEPRYINEDITFEYFDDSTIKVTSDCENSKIVSCLRLHGEKFPFNKIKSKFMTSITRRWNATLKLKREGNAMIGELKIEYLDQREFSEDVPVKTNVYKLTFTRIQGNVEK